MEKLNEKNYLYELKMDELEQQSLSQLSHKTSIFDPARKNAPYLLEQERRQNLLQNMEEHDIRYKQSKKKLKMKVIHKQKIQNETIEKKKHLVHQNQRKLNYEQLKLEIKKKEYDNKLKIRDELKKAVQIERKRQEKINIIRKHRRE